MASPKKAPATWKTPRAVERLCEEILLSSPRIGSKCCEGSKPFGTLNRSFFGRVSFFQIHPVRDLKPQIYMKLKHMIHANDIKQWQMQLDWFDWFPETPSNSEPTTRPTQKPIESHRIHGISPIFCLLTGKPWFSQAWKLGGGGVSLCGGALLSKKINQDAPQRLLASRKRGKHVISGNFAENHAFYGKGICDCSLEVPGNSFAKRTPRSFKWVRFLGSLAYFFSGVWRGIFLFTRGT